MTSFNDRAADKLFMVLLRGTVFQPLSLCVQWIIQRKSCLFQKKEGSSVWSIWREITLKAVSSKLIVTDARMSGHCFLFLFFFFHFFLQWVLHSLCFWNNTISFFKFSFISCFCMKLFNSGFPPGCETFGKWFHLRPLKWVILILGQVNICLDWAFKVCHNCSSNVYFLLLVLLAKHKAPSCIGL